MKKAVISTGAKQYLVKEGDVLSVEKLPIGGSKTKTDFEPLMIIDGDKINIGHPALTETKVSADIIEPDKLSEKTVSIRYKAKKRVHTVKGHRQHLSVIKITKIV
jgi:large subunit ribosomal protein L21